MSAISMTVEVLAGTSIEDAASAAVELATRTGVTVRFKFNDVHCSAHPNTSADTLAANWWRVVNTKSVVKYANSL